MEGRFTLVHMDKDPRKQCLVARAHGVKRHAEAPVRGHDVKKDIPMLMRLTKDTSVAFNKGQGRFSKS